MFIYFSDRMAEIIKKEVYVKESEITSTVEETCFVNISEDDIKLENTEIKGNFDMFTILKAQRAEGCEVCILVLHSTDEIFEAFTKH